MMAAYLSALCLLSGALISLLAAVGILRLPDVFMRMHAATKAGVVGCGLILMSVAIADGSTGTILKVLVAITFLLLTTPVAGHLLGRAAYASGAPFWHGTVNDQLDAVLQRRAFGPAASKSDSSSVPLQDMFPKGVEKVVIALAQGPNIQTAIKQAAALAQRHNAELCGVAIVDEAKLFNVGSIPIGGGFHASELRKWRLAKARQAAADVIQDFELHAQMSGLKYSLQVEEGRPEVVLRSLQEPGCLIAVAPGGWFDQGVLQQNIDTVSRLVHRKVHPILVFGAVHETVHRIRFVHDGSQRSVRMWHWLLEAKLWPEATLVLSPLPGTPPESIELALQEARSHSRQVEQATTPDETDEYVVIGNAECCRPRPLWLGRKVAANSEKVLAVG